MLYFCCFLDHLSLYETALYSCAIFSNCFRLPSKFLPQTTQNILLPSIITVSCLNAMSTPIYLLCSQSAENNEPGEDSKNILGKGNIMRQKKKHAMCRELWSLPEEEQRKARQEREIFLCFQLCTTSSKVQVPSVFYGDSELSSVGFTHVN